jgi:hypothetical protein
VELPSSPPHFSALVVARAANEGVGVAQPELLLGNGGDALELPVEQKNKKKGDEL